MFSFPISQNSLKDEISGKLFENNEVILKYDIVIIS